MEKNLINFKLPMIENLSLVNDLVCMAYRQTGLKFRVSFNGSKGYLSNIEISCEGKQAQRNNIIWVERLRTAKGKLMSKNISLFYSDEGGVRVEVEGESFKEEPIIKRAVKTAEGDDRLPF